MFYFSYGSNMSIRRLQHRLPAATRIDIAVLEGHELKFHKISNIDGSAKCDAMETGDPRHCVHGVVFDITEQDKQVLDKVEGLGCGYEWKHVSVILAGGSVIKAFTYYATRINPALKPLDWYREHVTRGAKENGLPEEYIQQIESTAFIADPDSERKERELSIYH